MEGSGLSCKVLCPEWAYIDFFHPIKLEDPLNKFLSNFIDCEVSIILFLVNKLKFSLSGISRHPIYGNIVLILDNLLMQLGVIIEHLNIRHVRI
jgi:hypothetical protein